MITTIPEPCVLHYCSAFPPEPPRTRVTGKRIPNWFSFSLWVTAITILATNLGYGVTEVQTLLSFNGTNGAQPQARVTWGLDGNFYGTTELGGKLFQTHEDRGSVFKLSPQGDMLWSFPFQNYNGSYPKSELTSDAFGYLYGTTFFGGVVTNEFGYRDAGTVFKLNRRGRLIWSAMRGQSRNGCHCGFGQDGVVHDQLHDSQCPRCMKQDHVHLHVGIAAKSVAFTADSRNRALNGEL